MNTDRLLRDVEKRLKDLPEPARAEVMDALREEISRERRWIEPGNTVENERERRVEAETLRDVLEAINRGARLEVIIEEVLKQLARIVTSDCCWLTLLDPDDRLRVIAARGTTADAEAAGTRFRDALSDLIRERLMPLHLADVQAEERFTPWPGSPLVRSWAVIPLLVEGELLGLLALGRVQVEPFGEEELHRAKALAFSAAAAIRKAKLLDQVKRYAALMEQVVAVDHVVFNGATLEAVAQAILDGAGRIGSYQGGLLVVQGPSGPRVAASMGEVFEGTVGKPAPSDLASVATRRLAAARLRESAEMLGVDVPAQEVYLVPVSTPELHVGTLVLLDPEGETPDDRLMEAYASRAATAYRHAALSRG
jgi:GAF domain